MPIPLLSKPWLRSLGAGAVVFALGWPALKTLTDSLIRAHWFHLTGDEALHTEVIEVLAQTGRYADWAGTAFVPILTTGPTVMLPAALLKWLTGVPSAVAGRAVLLAYYLGSWAVLALILRAALQASGRAVSPAVAIAIGLGLYHFGYRGLQDTGYYTYGVMGEGACAFYLLLTAWMLTGGRWVGAGASATLAVMSKPFMAFLPLALLWVAARKGGRRGFLRAGAGLALPALIWLGYMSWVMGPLEVARLWLGYPALMRSVNGAGLPTGGSHSSWSVWVGNLVHHLSNLTPLFKLRALLLLAAGLVLALREGRKAAWAHLLGVYLILHGAWWLVASPAVQARYAFPAAVAGWAAFAVLATVLLTRFFRWTASVPAWGPMLAACVLVGVSGTKVAGEWRQNRGNFESCGLCRQLAVQSFWKSWESRPSRAFTLSQDHGRDLDLVLSAPTRLEGVRGPIPRGAVVLLGENPRPDAAQLLESNRCAPIFTVSRQRIGIWSCPP